MLILKWKSSFYEKTFYRKGFTLTEVLVVMSIMSIILMILLSTFFSLENYHALERDAAEIRSFLEKARMYTQGSREDSSYGVYFSEGEAVLFRGDSWSTRLNELDEHSFNRSVSVNTGDIGSNEIVFNRLFGEPSVSGDLPVSFGDRDIVITVLPSGMLE